MAQCERHPDRGAEVECSKCGRQLCSECVEVTQEDRSYCYDCAVGLELAGFKAKDELEQGKRLREKTRRRIGTPVIVLVAVIAALAVGEIAFLLVARGSRGSKSPVTSAQEVVWNRDECLVALQGVRAALDDYRKRNNAYPGSLEELKKAGVKVSCPLTGAEYKYEGDGPGYSLSCPNPEKHGVRQITASGTSVPRYEK